MTGAQSPRAAKQGLTRAAASDSPAAAAAGSAQTAGSAASQAWKSPIAPQAVVATNPALHIVGSHCPSAGYCTAIVPSQS